MASLKEILIHVEQMEDGSFTLSAFDENEQPLPYSHMKSICSNGMNPHFTEPF